MKLCHNIILAILLLSLNHKESQAQHIGFSKTIQYGSDTFDRHASAGVILYDNNETKDLFFPLQSAVYYTWDYNPELIRCDIDGNILLRKADKILGSSSDYLDVVEMGGFLYWGGWIRPVNPLLDEDNIKPLLTKTDKDLNIIWRVILPNDNTREGVIYKLKADQKKNQLSLLVGKQTSWSSANQFFPKQNAKIELIKMDSGGNVLWDNVVEITHNDYITSLITDSNDNYIIAGRTYGWGTGDGNPFLYKGDENGQKKWHRIQDIGRPFTYLHSMISSTIDTEDSYVGVGYRAGSPGGGYISKYNAKGEEMWSYQTDFFENISEFYKPVCNPSDSSFTVSGFYRENDKMEDKGLVAKFDYYGNPIWYSKVTADSSSVYEYIYNLIALPDGSYIGIGQAFIGKSSRSLGWLVRVDSLGCYQPDCTYLNTKEINDKEQQYLMIYPNPAIDYFSIDSKSNILKVNSLILYDMLGRKIKEYSVKPYKNARYSLEDITSGTYLLELQTSEGNQYIKIRVMNN